MSWDKGWGKLEREKGGFMMVFILVFMKKDLVLQHNMEFPLFVVMIRWSLPSIIHYGDHHGHHTMMIQDDMI